MLGFYYTKLSSVVCNKVIVMGNPLFANINVVAMKTMRITSDQEMITHVVQKYNPDIPNFGRYAVKSNSRAEVCTNVKDSRDIFMTLSTNATWLIWTLDKARDKDTNIARIQPKNLTDAEKAKYARAKIELENLNVILTVKSTYFLINPTVFLPDNKTFEDVLKHWLALGGKL